MKWRLVPAVLRIDEAVVVAHLERPAGDQGHPRRCRRPRRGRRGRRHRHDRRRQSAADRVPIRLHFRFPFARRVGAPLRLSPAAVPAPAGVAISALVAPGPAVLAAATRAAARLVAVRPARIRRRREGRRDRAPRREGASLQRRMVGCEAEGAEDRVHHRKRVGQVGHRAQFPRHRVDVLPRQLALGRDLEEVTFGVGAQEGVAVRQPLRARTDVAEEAVAVAGPVAPDDLPRDVAGLVVGVVLVGLAPVAGLGRIDVAPGVAAVGVQERVDLDRGGSRRALEKVLPVVEDHQVPRAGDAGRDPRGVVRAPHLLVAAGRRIPVLEDARRVALGVAGGVAEAVQEVARRTGRLRDRRLQVAGDERAVVVDDVQLALHRVDHDVARLRVVVDRVAVQPVALQRPAGQVDVDPAGALGRGLRVIGLRRIEALHEMVGEPPFPDHVALHVDLDHRVHLPDLVGPALRVGAGRDRLLMGDPPVGDVERGRRVERLVVDPYPVVVRRVALALLGVLPDLLPVPVDLGESAEAARIVA